MAKRTFGAIRAAGTRIEEQEGDPSITPGALGFGAFTMLAEKGPVGKSVVVTTRQLFDEIYGGIIDDGQGPDNARDFFSLAGGAGGLAITRITDGNERAAEIDLYARNADSATPIGKIRAHNGGRWGGKSNEVSDNLDASGDLLNTTLQLPTSIATDYKTDEFKDGWIELDAVSNKRYPIIGNTAAGLITVAADQKMKDEWTAAAAPTNLRFYVVLENEAKELSVSINDGEEIPSSEFSIEVFVDGDQARKWGNLHTDPTHARYWVDIINNDDANYYIEAVDSFVGAHVAATRPANVYQNVAAVTATTVTLDIAEFEITTSPGGGDPTFALGTSTDDDLEQTITITMADATTGAAVSDRFGALGTVTLGTLFDPHGAAGGAVKNKWAPPFTVTAGGTALALNDVLTIRYRPLKANEAAGGVLYPRKQADALLAYRIDSNTHKVVTVVAGSDMVTDGVVMNDDAMLVFAKALRLGRDGNADIVDADYLAIWDAGSSPFNDLKGQNLGMVKFATPGVTSTAVQKAGIAYAESQNGQYRVEVPNATSTENGALNYINNTIGRSDHAKVFFPTYGQVPHPDPASAREGKLKTISTVGMQLGREARIVADYLGYHRAQAGVIATLPRLLKLPTGDRKLDEERLNPAGINVITKKGGNFVLWGDRTIHTDPAWKFAHQREQMSYYENVLLEEFDFIIFEINDAESDKRAQTALVQFFQPEWVKRAIRGATFQEAAVIKIDAELNTAATRAAGDKIASVELRLADTTERFIIKIGKQGVFDQVA